MNVDYTKPVRWVDDKSAAEVLKVNADGSAWVIERNGCRAFLYHRNGTWAGVAAIENIPEPIVCWVVVWKDGATFSVGHESWCREKLAFPGSASLALLKLTYTPGHASVEIIEERK